MATHTRTSKRTSRAFRSEALEGLERREVLSTFTPYTPHGPLPTIQIQRPNLSETLPSFLNTMVTPVLRGATGGHHFNVTLPSGASPFRAGTFTGGLNAGLTTAGNLVGNTAATAGSTATLGSPLGFNFNTNAINNAFGTAVPTSTISPLTLNGNPFSTNTIQPGLFSPTTPVSGLTNTFSSTPGLLSTSINPFVAAQNQLLAFNNPALTTAFGTSLLGINGGTLSTLGANGLATSTLGTTNFTTGASLIPTGLGFLLSPAGAINSTSSLTPLTSGSFAGANFQTLNGLSSSLGNGLNTITTTGFNGLTGMNSLNTGLNLLGSTLPFGGTAFSGLSGLRGVTSPLSAGIVQLTTPLGFGTSSTAATNGLFVSNTPGVNTLLAGANGVTSPFSTFNTGLTASPFLNMGLISGLGLTGNSGGLLI
jgi:hypothetical protein